LLSKLLPGSATIVLLMVAMVLINGALHLDGFIDTCDGLAGNKPVEERWRVMRDSRVGAFGVVGGVLLLITKFVALSSIPRGLLPSALVLMPAVSRWLMVYAIVAYPYARPTGLGTAFKQHATWEKFGLATFFVLLVTGTALWWRGVSHFYVATLVIIASAWLAALGWSYHLSRKFGGLTGDSYGAVNEFSETVILLIVSALAFNRWLWVV